MNATIATATVLSCCVGRVETAVAQLNTRAKRLRAAPYELVVSAPRIRVRHERVANRAAGATMHGDGYWYRTIREEVVDVSLSGTPVKADGWVFVAKLDFLSDDASGVVISKAPGFESLELERPDGTRCDHCHTSRRRSVCYVVQNESGARKVVGSSCLTDFTGMGRNVERLVALAFAAMSVFEGADEWGQDGGGSRSRADGLVEYLTAVAAVIRCYGWMSRKAACDRGEDRASADLASGWLAMAGEPDKRRKFFPEIGTTASRADHAVALRSIHWCEAIDASSDYEENIRAIANAGYILPRHSGLAASIVAAWMRHREALVRQASRPRANDDATCGTVGKRETFTVLVAGARNYESDFGVKTRVSLVDVATGAEIVWWASGSVPDEIMDQTGPRPETQAPTQLRVTATVKKHDTYKGRRQTVVSRLVMAKPEKPRKRAAKVQGAEQ